jgi:hypothetical protein
MANLENLKPFKKGHKKLGGRKKGVRNKFPVELREAVLVAAQSLGADGKGSGGLVSYLRMLARKHPTRFIRLLSRTLMLPVRSPDSYPCCLHSLTAEEFKELERLLFKAQIPFRPVISANGLSSFEHCTPTLWSADTWGIESLGYGRSRR